MKMLGAIGFCMLFWPFLSSAQPYNNLTLSTAAPETGKSIHFVYKGDFVKNMKPHFTLYYSKGRGAAWQTLKIKHTKKGIEGTFILPDSTLSFCIKPTNNRRETGEYFTFHVYKNGLLQQGSLASSATFHSSSLYSGLGGKPDKAMAVLEQEFEKNPELKSVYLIDYYRSARNAKPDILGEMSKTWQDSIQSGSDEKFINNLYQLFSSRLSKEGAAECLKRLLQKYPQGEMAISQAIQQVRNLNKNTWTVNDVDELANQFKASKYLSYLDDLYVPLINNAVSDERYTDFEKLVKKVNSVSKRSQLYFEAAKNQLSKSDNLSDSERYLRAALAGLNSMREGEMVYYVFDRTIWNNMVNAKESNYLSLYADLLYHQENKLAAIDTLKKAIQLANWNVSLKERYLQLLLETGQTKLALDSASAYVADFQINDRILDLLEEAFVKTKGSTEAFALHLQSLYCSGKKTFWDKRQEHLINEKSIDFNLKDIDGNEVKLSSFKNKAVLLFFFDTNVSRYENGVNEHLAMFNQKIEEFKNRKDLVWLFIDRTSIFDSSAEVRSQQRLERIKAFMGDNQYQFQVLIDRMHYDSGNSGNTFFEIADAYSSDSLNQFYLIDKKGMVTYRSYPTSEDNMEKFEREITNVLERYL